MKTVLAKKSRSYMGATIAAAVLLLLCTVFVAFVIVPRGNEALRAGGGNVFHLLLLALTAAGTVWAVVRAVKAVRVPEILLECDDNGLYLHRAGRPERFVSFGEILSVSPKQPQVNYAPDSCGILLLDTVSGRIAIDFVANPQAVQLAILEKRAAYMAAQTAKTV